MRRPPIACRRAVQSLQAPAPQHIWVPDEVLSLAVHRFFHSTCPQQKRHGSNVPGPLEARKRAAKRRMTASAGYYPLDSFPTSFSLGALFGHRSDPQTSWRYEPPSLPRDAPTLGSCMWHESVLYTQWTLADTLQTHRPGVMRRPQPRILKSQPLTPHLPTAISRKQSPSNPLIFQINMAVMVLLMGRHQICLQPSTLFTSVMSSSKVWRTSGLALRLRKAPIPPSEWRDTSSSSSTSICHLRPTYGSTVRQCFDTWTQSEVALYLCCECCSKEMDACSAI